MKSLVYGFIMLLVASCSPASAYPIFQGPPAGKTSDTAVIVSPNGNPQLKQDMINNVNGGQPTRNFGYMFGRNPQVQNVRCDLWEGPTCIYVFPAAAQQMAVSSSSAADTNTAGTGCRQVEIHYLNASYVTGVTTVILNGVTPVNTTPTNILRINSFHCSSAGTGGVSAGNISLKNTGATITYGYMSAGDNYARQAIFTVPAGYYGYVSHWQASMGAASGSHFTQVDIFATQHDGNYTAGLFLPVDTVGLLNNSFSTTLPIPIRIPPMTDVKMSAISDASNANAVVNGAVMGWFEAQ